MGNLYSILRCKSLLKNCKPKFNCSFNDREDLCTVYHICHVILMSKIKSPLKLFVKNAFKGDYGEFAKETRLAC